MAVKYKNSGVNANILTVEVTEDSVTIEPQIDIEKLRRELEKLGVSIEDIQEIPCG